MSCLSLPSRTSISPISSAANTRRVRPAGSRGCWPASNALVVYRVARGRLRRDHELVTYLGLLPGRQHWERTARGPVRGLGDPPAPMPAGGGTGRLPHALPGGGPP